MAKVELVILSLFIAVYSKSNYGPFNLKMTKITFCNGPKRIDCAVNTGKIVNNGSTLIYDMNITENVKDVYGNLYAISETKQAVKLQMKTLCAHPFWLPFMKKYVNITKDCVVVKGTYHMEANAQELAQKYYGGSFMYGKWTFKSVMYNNRCNFGCSSIDMALTPQEN